MGCLMSSQQKTKELKIVTRHVITLDAVKRDERKIKLLNIINAYGEISEKALTHLIYLMKNEKDFDMGYKFITIANVPSSKELKEDLMALLYVGLLEVNPRNRRLRLTSLGKEFLSNNPLPEDLISKITDLVTELKPKVVSYDVEIDLVIRSMSRRRRRR